MHSIRSDSVQSHAAVVCLTAMMLLIASAATAQTPNIDPAPEPTSHSAVISNGLIKLGVRDEGHLNIANVGIPSSHISTRAVGLRIIFPDGSESEATAPGCLCEGWGASGDLVQGGANVARGGLTNLNSVVFTSTPTTAKSEVNVGTTLKVVHNYEPLKVTDNLYGVTVTITNISGGPLTDVRYRRVMDWDISPTTFNEFVTINSGTSLDLAFVSDNGFDQVLPLNPPGIAGSFTLGDRVDDGPRDHGALFQFEFSDVSATQPLANGDSVEMTIYYGAAFSEADAIAALAAVGAEAFSFGQPNVSPPADHGEPNTFIFAFGGINGETIFPLCSLAPETTINPPGSTDEVACSVSVEGEALGGAEVTFAVKGQNPGGDVATTDPAGEALFSYSSDGGKGADTIEASGNVLNSKGDVFPFICQATKFWDNDCQPNGIADTCDLDCNGFGGACNVTGCGGSTDATGDGVPDECNRPPVAQCTSVTVPTDAGVCTAPASIDNGSFDPDPGDAITSDQTPAGPYELGDTEVTLKVTDPSGLMDSCPATVTVVDEEPPSASAELVPVVEDRALYGHYGPDDSDHNSHRTHLVQYSCDDTCGASSGTATINGHIPVENGQAVCLEFDEETEVEHDKRCLEIEASYFELVVTCTDAAGNSSMASHTPDSCTIKGNGRGRRGNGRCSTSPHDRDRSKPRH